MAYNKVEANGQTLIDLTSNTVTADTLVSGRTAHLASGERVTGTFEPVTGVKGNAETEYRTGNVNLTPANIGAATSAQGTNADSAVQTIKMNGNAVTKTSGVVDLGTVITAHQDISGKADKSATVSTVTYDTTNKKLTKTINGTTSDVVTTAKLKTDMALSKSDVGLGNVGNFKAVSTVASQGLTDTEKANARTNIGTGNQVTLTGSVTGSATFADGNAAITTNLKSCNVGNNSGTAHPGWYKVAESDVFTGLTDKTLLLYAERGINPDSILKSGMLEIHARTASDINSAPSYLRAQWLNGAFTIPKDSIALTYSKTNHVATLWIYLDAAYDTWRFTVLSESSVFDRANNSAIWTLYNTRYADAQSSLPDSSDNTIAYPISGQLDKLGYYGLAGRSTNTTTNPWALIAEANAFANNNLGLTLLLDYTFTPSDHTVSSGTGILAITVRRDANKAIIVDRSYVKWLTKTSELNVDDVIVTYNNNTNSVQVWGRTDYPYKAMRIRPLSGGFSNTFDVSKWTFTTALNTNLYESYPTGDDITVLTPTCDIQEQVDYNTNNGVKNLLKINIPEKTFRGLTFTPQSDGTIIINGTANTTSTALVYWNLENPSGTTIPTQHSLNKIGYGNFIMSLNGDEALMAGIYLQILYYDTIIVNPPVNAQVSIGESKSITIDEDKKYVWFRMIINTSINGKTFDNFVLKPMIRDASIVDNTFQPYAKSNAELTRYTDDIQEQIECININAAYVPATGEVHITNTSDFTQQLFSKLYVHEEVRFAVLHLSDTSSTYHIKAIINTAAITQATALEATFINDDTLYRFYWASNGTPTLTRRTLSFV